MVTIGDLLLQFIHGGFWHVLNKGDSLLSSFRVTFALLLLFSITVNGTLVMTGDLAGSGKKIIKTAVWAILGLGVVQVDIYSNLIVSPITDVRNNFAIYMMSDGAGTIFQGVQGSFAKLMGLGFSLVDSGSIMTNIMPILVGGLILLVSGCFYLMIVVNLLFSEMCSYLLFFFGLFIIPLGAFESARQVFKSWCTAILKYSFVFIVTGSLVSLLNGALYELVQGAIQESYQDGGYSDSGISWIYLGAVIILSGFGVVLMAKVMEFTTEITSGVMSEGSEGTKSLSNSFKGAVNASKFSGNALSALKKSQGGA